jgi:hypothetical protein
MSTNITETQAALIYHALPLAGWWADASEADKVRVRAIVSLSAQERIERILSTPDLRWLAVGSLNETANVPRHEELLRQLRTNLNKIA